jgi:subtilase-type serine protease
MQGGVGSNRNGNTIMLNGFGTWQMGGNSTGYQDNTMINGGTFQLQPGSVYGTTTAGTVTIGPAGTLAYALGSGNFPLLQGTNLNLNGALAVVDFPGSSIAAAASAGSVQGIVALAGAPILVNGTSFAAGSVLQQGSQLLFDYQFVFASPTQLDLLITNEQTLMDVVIQASGSQNAINVAAALNVFDVYANPGQLADYVLAISNASSPQAALVLIDPLHGEVLTGAYGLLWNQLTDFTIQIDERLNTHGVSETATALNTQGRIVLASTDKTLPLRYASGTPWVGWGQILGGFGRQNEHHDSNAYDSRTAGVTAGFDRSIDRNWRLGAAINYQRGILDWDKYNAETRSNTLAGSLYGSYDQGSWFARSQIGGGGSWVNNRRDILLTVIYEPTVTASSKPTLPFFDGRVSTGYHLDYMGVRVTPSAGLFYVHTTSSAYSEKGAGEFNLRVKGSNQDNLEAQGNLEVAYVATINERPVTLRANYGVGFETLDKQATITTGFLSFPSLVTFQASSLNVGRFRQFAELGLNVDVAKNVRFRLDYLGIFQRHEYNHIGAVGVKVVF